MVINVITNLQSPSVAINVQWFWETFVFTYIFSLVLALQAYTYKLERVTWIIDQTLSVFNQYALYYNYRQKGQERLRGNLCLCQVLKQQLTQKWKLCHHFLILIFSPPNHHDFQENPKNLAECLGCSFPYNGSEWGQGLSSSQNNKMFFVCFFFYYAFWSCGQCMF